MVILKKILLEVEKYIEEAADSQADVIVFPEMWNTGYALISLNALPMKMVKKQNKCFPN